MALFARKQFINTAVFPAHSKWRINKEMIKLTKFLLACDVPLNLENYKVHLATGLEYAPLTAFFEGKFKEWQADQSRKNFECDMVIGLIELDKYKWLSPRPPPRCVALS